MEAERALALVGLAERCRPLLLGLDASRVLEDLGAHATELDAALSWLLEHGQPDSALRLASALTPFWIATGRLTDGAQWLDRTASAARDSRARGLGAYECGLMWFWCGNDDRAERWFRRGAQIGRRAELPEIEALALTGSARVALRTDVQRAHRLATQAWRMSEPNDDTVARSSAAHVLGVAAQMAGDLHAAREWMLQRMAMAREEGNHLQLGAEAGNLSMVERRLGNWERAGELAHECLQISVRRGDEWSLPYGLSALAAVAVGQGLDRRAALLLGAAEAMLEAQRVAWPPDERQEYDATLSRLTERLSADQLSTARETGGAMDLDDLLRLALDSL